MLNNTTVTFAGNLVADPELKFTPAGRAVANFRVLVNRRVKNGENWVNAEATGHDCELWGKPAEHLAESARRGDRVIVTGELYTETWNDNTTGDKRYRTKVTADEVGMSTAHKAVTGTNR